MPKYKKGAVGGTFDILHVGHKYLIEMTFKISQEVVIGVSSDDFVIKLNKEVIHDYETRIKNIQQFIQSKFPKAIYQIFKLEDYFGPTRYLEEFDVIVLTPENSHRLDSLNTQRKSEGLTIIHGEIIDFLKASDGLPISTTRIKDGEIDSDGNSLI